MLPTRSTQRVPGRRAPGDGRPAATGLYDPAAEHDACGVGFVADLHGRRSHGMLQRALEVLRNLDHRGATGAEENTGDGAGILIQVPDAFLRAVVDVDLPAAGAYAVGTAFLPAEATLADEVAADVEKVFASEGLTVLAWRDVPTDASGLGSMSRDAMPIMRMVLVAGERGETGIDLDRRCFIARKRAEHEVGAGDVAAGDKDAATGVYFPSLSCRTLVYKGMLTVDQLPVVFPDLLDERLETAIALVHSRFSTNTFPSWPLAHPYRLVAHNGEINTVMGNENWMRAREALLESDDLPGLERAYPICTPGSSDTCRFDEALELLALGGRSLPHAVLMMIPEAWEHHESMSVEKRAFYEFHSTLMEPWDGPASVTFTDGTVVGAVLDRNGLRPSRYWVTDDGLVVMASEVGVLDLPVASVIEKGRLQPGRMFLVDTAQGRIIADDEIKADLAAEHPYAEWLHDGLVHLDDLPPRHFLTPQHSSVVAQQRTFGYTTEELKILIAPMAKIGIEALGSMGTDTPIAALSARPRLLFDYFSQLFAQVTNPPLDAIREELVTSLGATLGPESNLLAPGPSSCRQIAVPYPILTNEQLANLLYIDDDDEFPGFRAFAIDGLYPVAEGGEGLRRAIEDVRAKVSEAIAAGAKIIILSDRHTSAELAPIPALLLVGAVHHHLIREKTRTQVGLIVETGEAREVHHMALLCGYGAAAINPYLAFDSIIDLVRQGILQGVNERQAVRSYVKAAGKGILKVMSKMGVSTVASYTGAQIFEAVGLSTEVVDEYFTGTTSKLGGIGLDVIAEEGARRHRFAHMERPEEAAHRDLWGGGEYQWRREGELHLFNPETVFKLQHATRTKRYDVFKQYSTAVDDQSRRLFTLRGLFDFAGDRQPIPVDEVEPVESILTRFSTGAMSYGSISAEAHETLAIAMNRIGAKSNTGEGGEDVRRFTADDNGDLRRSAIKQVASGRFGVTSEYLTNADDIQIKIAQGAKPGEGGQLPGAKVYPWIAETRFSTPGVGLISPPPHHDIYSIEDLKQLIHDLKNANPSARIHVKLVSEVGVGTVAAGVSKAKADVVLISGHDGGTGAAPLTSLKHAGGPWELGLAETQQTLLLNGL
ncbi:MAG: glutamate synthase large subunit, partial [Acidimicrobiales bacterium]